VEGVKMTPYNIDRARKEVFDEDWDDYEDKDIPYDDDDEDDMWNKEEDYEDYEEYYD